MDFNKVMIAGRLTRDPELRYLASGTAVVSLSLATNRSWTDKASGERREEALFVDIEFFDKNAETLNEHFKKGRPIFVEGRLKLDQWEKDGQKHSKMKIVGDQWRFCGDAQGPRRDAQGDGGDQGQRRASAPPRAAPARAPAGPIAQGAELSEDDIPF